MRAPPTWPRLDGIRGIAILMVVLHNGETLESAAGVFARVLLFVADHGWIGVQLFFVLSGFLITGILLDTRDAPNYYASFFARRTLRIFPLYYATLGFVLVVVPWIIGRPLAGTGDTVWLWLYLTNWVQWRASIVDALPHLWSLAVEEQFYLLWPLLLHRLSPRATVRLCLAIAVGGLVLRIVLTRAGVSAEALYMITVTRIDAMALGGAAAAWLRNRVAGSPEPFWARKPLISAAVVALGAGAYTHGFPRMSVAGQTVGYSALAVIFALAMLHGVKPSGPRRSPLEWAWLRSVGRYSYAMYLFHMPLNLAVVDTARQWVPSLSTSGVACAVYVLLLTLATYGLAYVSYHLFERRFLALKPRFEAEARPRPA